jgi:hypothetical protein
MAVFYIKYLGKESENKNGWHNDDENETDKHKGASEWSRPRKQCI